MVGCKGITQKHVKALLEAMSVVAIQVAGTMVVVLRSEVPVIVSLVDLMWSVKAKCPSSRIEPMSFGLSTP